MYLVYINPIISQALRLVIYTMYKSHAPLKLYECTSIATIASPYYKLYTSGQNHSLTDGLSPGREYPRASTLYTPHYTCQRLLKVVLLT